MPADEFGRFFRNRRTALGLSLSEFCRQNGFDKGNISRLERGLVKPPHSPGLLQEYADALQLPPNSEDWRTFMRYGAIARGKLPPSVSDERSAHVEAIFRRLDRRLHDPWVKARDLEAWSPSRDAQAALPTLVRRLIYATAENLTRIELPGGEGVQRHGWDGIVTAGKKSLFVPEGVSGWEISVDQHPERKASDDLKARTKGCLGLPPAEVTFVFVTSRKWDGKQKWRDDKRALGKWKSVEVFDSSDLEAWLEIAPGVDAWIAEYLGRRPAGVISISDYWESLSRLCEPRLVPELFLTAREKTAKELRTFLTGTPGTMPIECRSPVEALDFVAAYLETVKSDDTDFAMEEHDRIGAQNRTVIVRDRAQWDGLSQAAGQLNLIPHPSLSLAPEELAAAAGRGHRVLIAATKFTNHRLQPIALPRPSRYALEEVLRRSGFDREKARDLARTAGGSLSVLKRCVSTIPNAQNPRWCGETGIADFLPMLLAGAWDDANEVDRDMLSRLSGRPYAEVQKAAQRLTLVEDAPLNRIESRWRLVSPEDSWSLAGEQLTDELLSLFEVIAIQILTEQDETLSMSADERLRASILGTRKPSVSDPLRRAISETTAILGSAFLPDAKLPGARHRAIRIVRTTLQNADWLRWATLDHVLPLLAEAAPDEFLDAINVDLKRQHPALAKVLADDEEGHPFMSRCNHAGLLWALEGLAWSPELLPKVCRILAGLDEVDAGQNWGNRPAGSLCEILLPWYPQTAATVEQRIAVLKSLADRAPATLWKILFSMLPHTHSHSMPTRRPIWRDWMSDWREGTSAADYWRQVNAVAESILQLVGTDCVRWSKVLDELQLVPEPYRTHLVTRLQNFPVDKISPDVRRQLAEHLRKIIRRHRDFADTQWSLPAESVDALESALPKLLPDGICERHAWLFVPWIDLEGYRGNRNGMYEELDHRRADALKTIIDQSGLDGVLSFADMVQSPGNVGATLALTEYVADNEILPGLLRSPNFNHRVLAESYAATRMHRAGWEWVHGLGVHKWNMEDAAALMAQASFSRATWDFAEELGKGVFTEYWNTVPANEVSSLDQHEVEFACQRLLEAERPQDAIAILTRVVFDKVTASPLIVMDALSAFWKWRRSNPDTGAHDDTLHTIQGLFGWLQRAVPFANDEPTQRLAQLEWAYLSLLDGYGEAPKTLIRRLSEDPTFFANLIARLFRSKDERQPEEESSEEQRQWARHAYRLLMNWDRIPGTQPDNSIDEERLLEWIEAARTRCRESGHMDVADSQIGELLARQPQPEDENAMWPCEEICDAIEEADSDALDHGFQIGVRNSRGITCRSPLDGGDLERKEAAKYGRWAELCETEWPRTAASLRRVAKIYQFDAQQEDAEAAERAQERY